MAILIELPSALEAELTARADQRGVSASEQVTLMLQVVTALMRGARKAPFRSVIEAYLRQNSLDADQLAEIFEGLMASCLQNDDPSLKPLEPASPLALDPLNRDRLISLLRGRRSSGATSLQEALPLDRLVEPNARRNRVSALGSLSHLNLSTEAFIAEKRQETAREDRPR